jgi:two-component system sensor histidine kinase DesK
MALTGTDAWTLAGPGQRHVLDRLGPVFAGLWLVFLVFPLHGGWLRRDELAGVVGIVATVVFAGVYLSMWIRVSHDRQRLFGFPPRREAIAHLGALSVLTAVMIACLGADGVGNFVFIAVNCAMLLPARFTTPVAAGLVGCTPLLGPYASVVVLPGIVFGIVIGALAIMGMRAVSREIAHSHLRAAAAAERNRMARDLHDILGHSLTVITVKAELAGKLLDAAPELAAAELADLERLSREALADVRRTARGFREITLPGELILARAALAAAGIEADVSGSAGQVPAGLRELFAWAVREGVTNVIRHSGARNCTIALSATAAEIRDDGAGGSGEPAADSSGLAGLADRAAAAGARVLVDDLAPGFRLRVVRP